MSAVQSETPRVCMCVLNPARTDERVMREATALVEAGYQVTIVDVEHDNSRPHVEMERGALLRHARLSARLKRFYNPAGGAGWMAFKVLRMLYALWLVILTSADVYHAHDITALPACFVAAGLRRKRLVFDAHELPLVDPHIVRRRVIHWLAVGMLRWMLRRCDAAIAVSPPLVDIMRDLYGGPRAWLVRNLPLYQEPERTQLIRERLGLPVGTRIALYQGAIAANRSLDVLVQAARYLDPCVVIVLMGDGPLTEPLDEMITTEGVVGRIKMLPTVPYAELLNWTASADLGLIAYRTTYSLNVRYCLPNKLFEYLMAGLPALTSEMPAIEAIVRSYDAGGVAESLEPRALASAINELLADEAAWSRMRQNALAAARDDLRWEVEKGRLMELYATLLPAKTPEDGERAARKAGTGAARD